MGTFGLLPLIAVLLRENGDSECTYSEHGGDLCGRFAVGLDEVFGFGLQQVEALLGKCDLVGLVVKVEVGGDFGVEVGDDGGAGLG